MFTRELFVRTAQVLCIGTVATLASTVPASSAAAATHHVGCSQGALRMAITHANNTPGSDTLNLSRHCTYKLSSELPAITRPLVINGNHATITRGGPASFRILTVSGTSLTLRETTIANGNASGSTNTPSDGGGILVTGSGGNLTVDRSVIRNNRATYGGGIGVSPGAQATVTWSIVRDNSATQNGGGLVNNGTLTIKYSQISRNKAGNAGGGIASVGTLTVTGTHIIDNTAQTGGGLANGVPQLAGGNATLTNSVVRNNRASSPNPGGIYNNGGTVTLNNTTVDNNYNENNCLNTPTPVPGCSN